MGILSFFNFLYFLGVTIISDFLKNTKKYSILTADPSKHTEVLYRIKARNIK